MADEIPEIHERLAAGRLLSAAAAKISERLDAFCSWLLVGVGAAYSLIFANLASLQDLVSTRALLTSLQLLLIAIVFGVLQRWLAAVVLAGSETSGKAEQIGRELAELHVKIDFKVVFREMERGLYYPGKWIARSNFEKAMSGDFAASGRMAAFISQVQSWLAFAVVLLVLAAISVTICGVKV